MRSVSQVSLPTHRRSCRTPYVPEPTNPTNRAPCTPDPYPGFKAWPSCLLPAGCIPGNCEGVLPPKARDEIIIFKKTYKCHMKDHVQTCEKECPYVRTVQYTVEPTWEQLDLNEDCPKELKDLLADLPAEVVPAHSELAHCLQYAYDKCFFEDQTCPQCSDPPARDATAATT